MQEHEVSPHSGARRGRKRVGRGNGSGHGTYSGRGIKGQKSRSGGGVGLFFEGGQLPLVKRMPHKRGFINRYRVEYSEVNVGRLEVFTPHAEVTPESLLRAGLVRGGDKPVKLLGHGPCTRPLVIRVHKVTAGARSKIEAAGGRVEEA